MKKSDLVQIFVFTRMHQIPMCQMWQPDQIFFWQCKRSHSCIHLLRWWNNSSLRGWVWGNTPVQSVLKCYYQSNYSWSGLCPCDITQTGIWDWLEKGVGVFEKGVKILVDKKNNTGWICIIKGWLCTHTAKCQHTFQFKQLVKVHVALLIFKTKFLCWWKY